MGGHLKAFASVLLSVLLTGCASTYNLNKAITGTDCTTREECVKDLALPNTKTPEAVFIIEPAEGKNRMGLAGPKYSLYIDLCLAKSIKETFPYSLVMFSDSVSNPERKDVPIITISNLKDFGTSFWSGNITFEGDVIIKPKGAESTTVKKEIEATGSQGLTISARKGLFKSTPTCCDDFAKQLNDELKSENIALTYAPAIKLDDFEICKKEKECDNSLYLKLTNHSILREISLNEPISEALLQKSSQLRLTADTKDAQKASRGVHVHIRSLKYKEGDMSGSGAVLLSLIGGTAGFMVGGPMGLTAFLAGGAIGQTAGMATGAAVGSTIKSFTLTVEADVLIKKYNDEDDRTEKIKFDIKIDKLDDEVDKRVAMAKLVSNAIAERIVDTVFSE